MSAKSKGGRPTKGKVDHVGAVELHDLAVDPTWTREMAAVYRGILQPAPSNDALKFAGVFTACMINGAPVEVVEELFREIIAMKKEVERPDEGKSRNWQALRGYQDFKVEHGFKPTTAKLKAYLLKSPSRYRNLPDKADGTGWTRVWRSIGFEWLDSGI
jgi:hypothetical protein